MGKFSDSPYFLLKDFFTGRGNLAHLIKQRPAFDYDWPVIWADRDSVIFDDVGAIVWNLHYFYDPNAPTTDGSYLVGLETNIVTKGDGLIELWVKETEEFDVPSGSPYFGKGKQFLPITLRWKRLEDTHFVFTDAGLCNPLSGAMITTDVWPLTGNAYWFDAFDGHCTDYNDLINNARETYFRKDSIYHEWLQVTAPQFYPLERGHDTDIRNYNNTDKIFNYFGKIYKYIQNNTQKNDTLESEFRIIFDGLQEFVMRAIPAHQQTRNFDQFCKIFFDMKWHEVYNQLKNVWTLVDPMEIDEDFLGYLSKYYHMKDLIAPSLFRQREFVRDLIWLLKRKGTYVEFYIIWRTIANTINQLNIYEKWHDRDIIDGVHLNPALSADGDTHVDASEWQEFIYVEKPEYRYDKDIGGADIGWYNRYYGLSGESIVNTDPPSAFFNYPVKINNNPLTASEYAPDWGNVPNLDIPLPVYMEEDNRILSTHYKMEIDVSTEPLLPDAIVDKAIWDELWQYWEYLRPVHRVVDYNILIAPITDFSGCFVDLYEYGGSAYDRTRVMVDLRTIGGWISPHIIPDHNWPTCSPSGTISGAPSGDMTVYGESPSGGCHWVIKHPLNTKYLHTMATDTYYNQIVPDDIHIVDRQTVIMYWDTPTLGYAVIKKSHTKDIGGNPTGVWRANHYLANNEVVTEPHVYDYPEPDFKIYGNNVNTVATDSNYVIEDTGEIARSTVPASSGDFTFYVPSASGDSAAWIQDISTPSAIWEVPHHLYYRGVITAVYDWNNNQIHQYEFKMVGIDRAILEFDSPISGYAVFIPVANFSLEQLIGDFTGILRNGATWKGAIELGDLDNDVIAASGDVQQTEIYETDDFIYINIKLGPEIEGSFREFGIYNSHGDLMVYSRSSEIYKPYGTTLVLHFRLEKSADTQCGKSGYSGNFCG